MRRILFIFLICFYSIVTGQSREIDSLENLLLSQTSTKELIPTYLKLYDLKKNNSDSAYQYLIKADRLITKNIHDSIILNLNIARSTHHLFSGNYDSVFYFNQKKKIIDSVTYSKQLISVLTNKGLAEYYKSEYNKAISSHLKAAKISEKNGVDAYIARVYNNVGIAYIKLENWEKAEAYMLKSLAICKKFSIKQGIAYTLGNIGIIYKNQHRFDEAIAMYKESLEISQELNDDRAILRTNTSIGGLYKEKKAYNLALLHYQKSLQKAKELGDKQSASSNLLNMGTLYLTLNELDLAKKYLEQSLSISKDIGVLDHMMEAYEQLATVYEKKGKFNEAIQYYKNFEEIKDSIFNKEKLKSVNEIEAKYQTEKKDRELAEQHLILEKQEVELQKKRSQNTLMAGFAMLLLIASILLWFLYQQKQRSKDQEILTLKREQQVKTLESLLEGEENERRRIAKELHDGVNVDLSTIKYKLTSLFEKNNVIINEAVAMIDRSCEQVRAISHNLVPPSLKDFSLIEAIEDYCSTMNNLHSPRITFQHIGEPIELTKKVEINIFRIIQELVNNSIKHAEATEIDVQISHRINTIQLTIEDNGKGFQKKYIDGKGIGLQNINSRIEYLKAKIDFSSGEQGTSYIIDINTDIVK